MHTIHSTCVLRLVGRHALVHARVCFKLVVLRHARPVNTDHCTSCADAYAQRSHFHCNRHKISLDITAYKFTGPNTQTLVGKFWPRLKYISLSHADRKLHAADRECIDRLQRGCFKLPQRGVEATTLQPINASVLRCVLDMFLIVLRVLRCAGARGSGASSCGVARLGGARGKAWAT